MTHINEDNLIKFHFDLLEADERVEVEAHLKECPGCQASLERLRTKFAVLDVLAEQPGGSEALIQNTLVQIQGDQHQRGGVAGISRRVRWTARIAAVLLMSVGIWAVFVSTQSDTTLRRESVVSESDSDRAVTEEGGKDLPVAESAPAPVAESFRQQPADYLAQTKRRDNPEAPLTIGQSIGGLADRAMESVVELDTVEEPPPFAPASAIELNILPRREDLQLTIYNSADLTLVREKRHLTLKRGWNWLQFMWANTLIDPTSLELEPTEHADKIRVEQLVYPPRLRELGRWLLHSEVEGPVSFELTYFTSGLRWRAFYQGTLTPDERNMKLHGYVRVDNGSGEDYPDAQTRLLVGKVNLLDRIADLAQRQAAYGDSLSWDGRSNLVVGSEMWKWQRDKIDGLYVGFGGGGGAFDDLSRLGKKEIAKEGLSEYFLYTIEGTETIPDTWGKRLPSFEADEIPVESFYKYDEERYENQTIRFVKFKNDEEHQLGETPIPDGSIKIYRNLNEQQNLTFVGGSSFKYIPVGEEVELNLGPASLVEITPMLMDQRTGEYIFDDKGDIAGWDEWQTWRIEIKNTRDLPVKVEITRGTGTPYWKMENESIAWQKHDATHLRFIMDVQPRSPKVFDFVLHLYNGKRQDAFNK